MHIMSANFAKMLVWEHEYDVKFLRHKQRTPNTNNHQMPLNETPRKWSPLLELPYFKM